MRSFKPSKAVKKAGIDIKPLSLAEEGILHYMKRGWIVKLDDYGPAIWRRGEFDCYVPSKAFLSLVARGMLKEEAGDVFTLGRAK